MKIQSKLFVSIGCLFVAVAIFCFVLPHYISKKNVTHSETDVLNAFSQEIRKRAQFDSQRLSQSFDNVKRELTLSLSFLQKLEKLKQQGLGEWLAISVFMDYELYEIDLIQRVVQGDLKASVLLDPYFFDPVKRFPISDHAAWIVDQSGELYLGLRYLEPKLYDEVQNLDAWSKTEAEQLLREKYILVSWEELYKRVNKGSLDLKQIDVPVLSGYLNDLVKKVGSGDSKAVKKWLYQELSIPKDLLQDCPICHSLREDIGQDVLIDWTRECTNTFLQFLLYDLETTPYQDQLTKGVALFLPEGLFKIEQDIGVYLPKDKIFPRKNTLSTQAEEIAKRGENKKAHFQEAFIVNELNSPITFLASAYIQEDPKSYIMLGRSFKTFAHDIALDPNESFVVVRGSKVVNGYTSLGARIPTVELNQFPVEKMLHNRVGIIQSPGDTLSFSRYTPASIQGIKIYILRSIGYQVEIFQNILTGVYFLLKELSWKLLAVVIVAVVLALFFLRLISKKITQPLSDLVNLTDKVGKEGYNISLPTPLSGKDEAVVLHNSFIKMIENLSAKEKIRNVLDKVVSKEVAEAILQNPIELGGEEKVCSVLFVDIEGFTSFSEIHEPKKVVGQLNVYMSLMSEVIEKHHGVIDKYIGDAIMALFGAPLDLENHEFHAVQAAVEIVEKVEELNKSRTLRGLDCFRVRVGAQTGAVVAGNMGAENRLNYTVLGKNVNLASRLCAHAPSMGVLVTQDLWHNSLVQMYFSVRPYKLPSMKGISEMPEALQIERR